ncbi:hypothetical protein HAX54_052467 [Datura stramonium]|uniref:Uncharacterized protein n=1 Tax=Datura stramonium TaxID=4076 RepID=A0ABS8WRD9_DATST|nr:hypothetical protein [Datura stramonium]
MRHDYGFVYGDSLQARVQANILSIDMQPLWVLLGMAYWLSMRHDYACVCGESLQARVQANIFSIDMRPVWRINQCDQLAIDETQMLLCVQRLAAGIGPSLRLFNRHAALWALIDEAELFLCVRRLAAGTGQSQRLVNRNMAIVTSTAVGITRCSLLAIDETSDSLQARVQDNVLSIDMRPLWAGMESNARRLSGVRLMRLGWIPA